MRKGKKWLAAALSAAMIVQPLAGIGPVYAAEGEAVGVKIADNFTDSAFQEYVKDNFDKDNDGYLSDGEIADATYIDVSKCHPSVVSLKGIELFKNLSYLDCSGQSVEKLDIENLENLTYINISTNPIDSLTLPVTAKKLTYLDISNNMITSLTSLSDYNNLTVLNANSTNLSEIDVSRMEGLQILGVSGTAISTLDLGSNKELTTIYCAGMSSLSNLDVSDHEKLVSLYCAGTTDGDTQKRSSLIKLNVSGDKSLSTLNCSYSNIADLDISNTPALTTLNCSDTRLTSIDVSQNTSLIDLDVSNNNLGEISVINNIELKDLNVQNTGINKLDISTLSNLVNLDAASNSLAELNIASNSLLKKLNLANNGIQVMNLENHPDLKELNLDNNSLIAIDISVCPELCGKEAVFSCNGNSRDIELDLPNYTYDMGKHFSEKKYGGFHKAYNDSELPVAMDNNGKPVKDEYGNEVHKRNNNTIGYAAIQGIDASNSSSSVNGGQISDYRLTADPDADKITYNYYTGAGMGKVKFTLNIQNPLKVIVWYTNDGEIVKTGDSTLDFKVGDTTTLSATDANKTPHGNITWSSSNENVARIDSNTGELTCISAGTAEINVLLNKRNIGYVNVSCHKSVTGLYLVDQTEKDPSGKEIRYDTGAAINMDCGTHAENGSKRLDVKCVTEDGIASKDISGFTCKVTDAEGNESNKIVRFNGNTITTQSAGIAYLHFVSTDNPKVETVIQVNVDQRVNSVSLSQQSMTLITGGSNRLTATVSPNTAKELGVIWSSSNDAVATVDDDGNVKAINPGEADIICTAVDTEKAYGKCHVTVQPQVKGLTLNIDKAELVLGANAEDRVIELEAYIDAEDASIYKNLKWTSLSSDVATVATSSDKTKATVTARSAGTAVIRFEISNDVYVDCNIVVKQRATSIRINKDKTTIYAGDKMQVTATLNPANASDQSVRWESSDESVATIDENGLITAIDIGKTTITATTKDGSEKSNYFELTVKKYVSSITLDKGSLTLYVGERGVVKQTVLPEDANDRNVMWKSDNPDIATVSSGNITGVKAGTTTIRCIARDNSGKSAACKVTVVQQISAIAFSETSKTVKVGDRFTPNVILQPENASKTKLKWTSSDESVASIDNDGVITAKSRGTSRITCEAIDGIDGRKANASFTVTVNQPVTSIVIDSSKITLYAGKQSRITATVAPDNANNKNLEWTSSNEKVATVNNGSIIAVGRGTATITCKTTDGSNLVRKCTVTVFQPITELTFGKDEYTLNVGKTVKPAYKIAPSNADSVKINWTSSNTAAAKVAADGTVTAVSRGTATITATPADGVGTRASYRVNVLQPVTKITLNKTSAKINVGSSASINATIAPSNASERNVTWTTSNKKVATVSNGYVTAVGKGTATITCKAKDGSGKTAKCTITVVQPVKTLKLNAATKTLVKGKKTVLKAIVGPASASNKKVKWTTSNKKVATVSATGVVKVVGKGTAVITCTTTDGSNLRATCTINGVIRVSSIKLNKTRAVVKRGNTLTLTAKVAPSAANDKSVVWVSSNKKIATVSTGGVVTAKKKGKVTITCKAKDGSRKAAKCVITVK